MELVDERDERAAMGLFELIEGQFGEDDAVGLDGGVVLVEDAEDGVVIDVYYVWIILRGYTLLEL
jgi:hypothetical protein